MTAKAGEQRVYYVRYRTKGKWEEEAIGADIFVAIERAKALSIEHHTIACVEETIRYIHGRYEAGRVTADHARPRFPGDEI